MATHIRLTGRIRLLTASDRYDDERVTLTYEPRSLPAGNSTLNTTIITSPASFKLGTSNDIFGELFKWYEFSVALPASTSIKSFTATVTRVSTGATTMYDNAGHEYPLDDTVLSQDRQSCRVGNDATIIAAVRKSIEAPVVAKVARKLARQSTLVPAIEVEEWKGEVGEEVGDYRLVQIEGVQQPESYSTHFDVVAGESSVEYLGTNALGSKECEAF
ncbi:hypothetical protein E8E11_008197 [Didymella keratinophila]|nr:hypothetical protein E8E11_008197 [Didymella keratinophila]